MIVFCFSSGSTVANVSTAFESTYVLETSNISSVINDFYLTTALPALSQTNLTVNGNTGAANTTYLNTTTLENVNSGSKCT